MAELQLHNGDAARIVGQHGSVIGYARADSSMRRGVVSMAHCSGVSNMAEDPTGRRGAHAGRLVSIVTEDVQFDRWHAPSIGNPRSN